TNHQPLTAGTTFTLPAGETLTIEGARSGARAYLCVRGGLDGPLLLGSRSSLAPLRAGERLGCVAGTGHGRFMRAWLESQAETRRQHMLPGAQTSWFGHEVLFGTTFTVSPAANRMGLRLEGSPLPMPERELVSEPVCPGAVQVTRDGQCIILGVDGQT